jgi:hypothetical protein
VRYVLESVEECSVSLITCEPYERYFDNDCGCGCIGPEVPPCPDPSDAGVSYYSSEARFCEEADLPACPDGSEFFTDDRCGCGCRPAGPECPDESDPDVTYIAHSIDECAVIDYECAEGWDHFASECGCGCIRRERPSECRDPDYYVAHSPEECALIDYLCAVGWEHFADECGCGCEPVEECPDGTDPDVEYISTDVLFCATILFDCEPGWDGFSNDCGCGCIRTTPSECAGLDEASCLADPVCRGYYGGICDCDCPEPGGNGGAGCDGCGPECFVWGECRPSDDGALSCPPAERENVGYVSQDPDVCATVDFDCFDSALAFDNACGCGCIEI